jgi:uncharacterized repeat protein (TIGR01451 family)
MLRLVGAMCALWCGAGPAIAGAQTTPSPERLMTFVARVCPSYSAISANRARNDGQESLSDLGADSTYTGGDQVLPDREQTAQPTCAPLPGWRFTLGAGDQTRAVTGSWGSLARVTSPYPTDILTQADTALLDRNGDDTGQRIAGAVTVSLSPEQIERAANVTSLWAQGGTPDDPVLDREHPGQYGFGALRCSADNLNGDNVEWVSFPQGARHTFCFAYYVQPPPASGTITVRKELDAPAGTAVPPFRFTGNLSYNADGAFVLSPEVGRPASETFYRAGDQTWTFHEDDVPGWERTGVSCTSRANDRPAVVDQATGAVTVDLASYDDIVCTYTNKYVPPPPTSIELGKISLGGVGAFGFDLQGPEDRSVTLTTRAESQAASTALSDLPGGSYRLSERLPEPTPSGRWTTDEVACDGQAVDPVEPIALTLDAGSGHRCLFTNRFVPGGSLVLRKRTDGAAGPASFVVRPAGESSATYELNATTTAAGQTVRARGNDTGSLPLGRYEIVETNPTDSAAGYWTLASVICNGVPVGGGQGRVEVTLSEDAPAADCTFIDRFTRGPEPQNPSAPSTTPGAPVGAVGALKAADGPAADLAITKTVTPKTVRPGQKLRYRIVVTNRGPGVAYDVVGTEVRPPDHHRLGISISRGSCTAGRPVTCGVSRLAPGQSIVVIATVAAPKAGRTTNRVSVVSSTHDPKLSNNRASVSVRVRPARTSSPQFTG